VFSERRAENESRIARHADALQWSARLAVPHALAWLEDALPEDGANPISPESSQLQSAAHITLHGLFAPEGLDAEMAEGLRWRRDSLGKPYVEWEGPLAAWASRSGRQAGHFHVSNSHDGGTHLVLAAYSEDLVGLGIDLVYLPRLRRPGKDITYLRRFARQFMSETEWRSFIAASEDDMEEALRRRVAAHFSLMESASKACGTGLKIGAGMGRPTSLSKQALGVRRLEPDVDLLFDSEAQARLRHLGANRWEGDWSVDHEYLVSVVLLWR
jgi:phosphopantetheinyl transferase (holo-ACP synthase)